MRALCVAILLAVLPLSAEARVAVSVETRSSKGSIDYFVPELERALAQALAKQQLDSGREESLQAVLEERPTGELRLQLEWRGRSVEGEGRSGRLDQLVTEVVGKLRGADEAKKANGKEASPVGASPSRDAKPSAKPEPTKLAAAGGGKPDPKADTKPEPKAESKPEPKAEPKPDPKPEPIAEAKPEARDLAPPPSTPVAAVERRRVVAHAVADHPSGAYPTTGSLATQALYFFVARRLRLQVVPTGFGSATAAVIAEEIERSSAGSGIVLELRNLSVRPVEGAPPEVRVRIELTVVRDGRIVWHREVESPPTQGAYVRGRPVDPFYLAVLGALDSVRDELQAAF